MPQEVLKTAGVSWGADDAPIARAVDDYVKKTGANRSMVLRRILRYAILGDASCEDTVREVKRFLKATAPVATRASKASA